MEYGVGCRRWVVGRGYISGYLVDILVTGYVTNITVLAGFLKNYNEIPQLCKLCYFTVQKVIILLKDLGNYHLI